MATLEIKNPSVKTTDSLLEDLKILAKVKWTYFNILYEGTLHFLIRHFISKMGSSEK